jgi:MFS family permease
MATLVHATSKNNANPLIAMSNPNFRLYFFGQLVSVSGSWMQSIAQGFLVFSLTRSELWLGVAALVAGIPMMLLTPIAGVIVEQIPRRRLLMATQITQMVLAFILAGLTFSNMIQIWQILVLAFLLGVTNALDFPARQTFIVEVVGREELPSGIALTSILNSSGRVLGPTAAGFALVLMGPAWCFFINGVTFLAVIISLLLMQVPYAIQSGTKRPALTLLREGLAYARNDALVTPLLLLAALVGLMIVPIIQLLPAFADLILHSPKEGYAALTAGQGIGAVAGGALVSWLASRYGYGKLITFMMGLSAVANVLLAMQTEIVPAVAIAILTGFFLITQMVSINTLIQRVVPDDFRGRVLALYSLAMLGLAPFGALVLGWIASIIGTSAAIAFYGILSGILGTAVLIRWSAVRSQQ